MYIFGDGESNVTLLIKNCIKCGTIAIASMQYYMFPGTMQFFFLEELQEFSSYMKISKTKYKDAKRLLVEI